MEVAIDHVNYSCTPLIKTISPHIANVQMHLNVFEERNQRDIELPSRGLMNYNLCLNAETEQAHTECDSLYTVICVPNQMIKKKKRDTKTVVLLSSLRILIQQLLSPWQLEQY